MTNSIDSSHPDKIIEEVLEMMDEHLLSKLIDEPIEAAAAGFTYDEGSDITQDKFIEVTSHFVRKVYRSALPMRQQLSERQARAETIFILDSGYQTPFSKGYHAAYLDSKTELGAVLAQLCELIKKSQKEHYLDWVLGSLITRLDWHSKCRIVKTLFAGEYYLPPQITERPPALFTGQIPQFIKTIHDARHHLVKQLSAVTELSDF